ncbi:MAG: 50S ribosome-binding GTPase, partial [Proteobacteria bacterium]|nr:50S ribosome-binding GTPase [Pseudomonadota bacterium]
MCSSGFAPKGTCKRIFSGMREKLNIVIVGHVDHGKSTLVGRLFHDTNSLPEGKFEAIKVMCEKRGMPFEWAFLMDALQAERDQGITIDTCQIWFHSKKRDYVIIDAPGHKEFLKNMVTGAAASEAALLVIDADEGMQEQSRRHGYLLHL